MKITKITPGTKFESVHQYFSVFPAKTKARLKEMKTIIQEAAPGAEEVISYNMPAFKQHSVLVYYAAYEKHLGFYPTGSGIAAFQKEISAYKNSKGAVQFPLDEPLPKALITKMVKFRVKEDKEKANEKAKKKNKN
jgi:uncharacterized protein YdhG (YjbR/CyaY superfamily)